MASWSLGRQVCVCTKTRTGNLVHGPAIVPLTYEQNSACCEEIAATATHMCLLLPYPQLKCLSLPAIMGTGSVL